VCHEAEHFGLRKSLSKMALTEQTEGKLSFPVTVWISYTITAFRKTFVTGLERYRLRESELGQQERHVLCLERNQTQTDLYVCDNGN
jgi:hypothetical protein